MKDPHVMYTIDDEFVKQLETAAYTKKAFGRNPARAIAAKMMLVELGLRDASELGEAATPYVPKRKRVACPKSVRKAVFRAFEHCEYCGCAPDASNYKTVDRINPLGRYTPENVTMACLLCNSNKGRSDYCGPVRSLAIKRATL